MIHGFCGKEEAFFLRFVITLFFFAAGFLANAQTVDCSNSANCSDPYCQFAANIEKGCNCFDGLDNDGDGKVDKADSNCATYYGLIFVGESSDCSITPPGATTPFDLVGAPTVSGQNTSDTQSKVAVGDIDGDGIPDALITSKWNRQIRVVATTNNQADGSDAGDIKADFKTTGSGASIFSGTGGCAPNKLLFEHENMIADIDGNGTAEIFGIVSNRGGNPSTPPTCFYVVAFRYQAGGLVPLYNAIPIGPDRPGAFGIADMDGDGKAEIYLRDRIYAAETGKLLATGNGNWDLDVTAGPVAVNILGDNKMELVCGTKIFSIPNLSNRNPATPAIMPIVHDMNTITANKAYVKLMVDPIEYGQDTHSSCSVADVDRDGVMDVVITGALNSPNGPTAVFYWNVANGTVSHYLPTDPAYVNGWPWGTGRVNLGDANGDGRTDFSFVAGNRLHCLTTDAAGNLVPLWANPRIINDSRSGIVAVTIYDFNNDGDPEMVYRDSQELAVIDGATGTVKQWSAVCQSHTYTEGPIIADVNGDGGTDICVPCYRNNSFDITDPIQQQALGEVRLFFSSGNEWLPTRKVWNQPGYFVVNINDDLTLPFPQLDQNLIFGEGDCANGLPGPQMPLNVFLNQVPFLSADGCPIFPAPDLSFEGDDPANPGVDENGDGVYSAAVEVIPPICGDLAIQARFNIINDGDLPISDNIPVSFFVGDPRDPSITPDSLIFTTTISLVNLQVGDTYTSPFVTFNGPGSAFRLYIVLNNDGTALPITTDGSLPNECRIDNNIYDVFVDPDPFTTKIEKIKDNYKCENSAPDNGEVRVRIFKAGVEVTDYSQYGFQWYTGTAASHTAIAGATNYNLTGLAEGDYTAIVTNTEKGCVGLAVDTTVVRSGVDPEVVINVISNQTACNPPNGELQAVITGGNAGFTFEWLDQIADPIGVNGPTASNLVKGNYLVRVSKDGCTKTSLPATVEGPVVPDVQATTLQHVVDCVNPNSGVIEATALFNGVVQDPANYTFEWYFYNNATFTRGSILPGMYGTGETRTGLPVGFYQVTVRDNITGCPAEQTPITEVMSATVIPTAVITELSPLTSCDPALPNGRLQASVEVGGVAQDPSAFTFEWFKGNNTLPVNSHTAVSGTNGSIADAVAGGGIFYTVRVTTANNCSDTDSLNVSEYLRYPEVTLTPTDNGICDPSLATSAYNGTVTAAISFDGVAVADLTNYQITWHNGSLATDPVLAGETSVLLDERNGGFYTAVVERTDLGCVSNPVTAQVNNAVQLPIIQTDSIPSTNCAGGAPNGGVVVTSVLPADTYTYRWFDPANTLIGGATTNAISGRQGGPGQNFTVEVTLGSTGCRNTFATNIPDNKLNPILSLTPFDNSICDEDLGFNGSITSTFTDANAQAGHAYAYVWSTGSDMSNPMAGLTGASIANQGGGFYTATIRNTTLNCTSSPVTTEILNNQILPAISAVPTPSTNCLPDGANNGAITASVTNGLAGQTFSFQWSKGNLVSDPDVPVVNGGNTATITGQQGNQNYIVLVRNNQTGCENTLIQAIADNSVVPVLTLLTTDNSICDPALSYNGTVSRDVITDPNALGTDTYSFRWSTGNDMSSLIAVADDASPTLTNRNGGFYTVTVQNDRLGCVSNPVTAEVNNNQILPAISALPTPSTNCPGGAHNGAITASVTNVVGAETYSFQWSKGNLVADPDVPNANGGNTATIINQEGNQNYIVLVRNNQTGCENTLIQTIADNSIVPILTLTTTDNSICDPVLGFNGTVSRNTISDTHAIGTDTYSFNWSAGNDMLSPIAVTDDAVPTLGGRNGGFYTVTVTNDRLNCTSNPVTAEVNNNQILPQISAVPTPSTNCPGGDDNGAITASVTNIIGMETYSFQWSKGNLVADPDVPVVDGGNTATIINQEGNQNYIVLVRNNQSGCENTLIQTIADNSVVPVLTLTTTDNSICDPALGFNGTVSRNTITDTHANGTDTYSFTWSAGNNMSSPIAVADDAIPTLGGRNGGFYTVTVTNDRLNCTSNPVTAEVNNNQILPAISAVFTPSTNCPGGAPNGAITASVTNILGAETYSFQWSKGNLVADPDVPNGNGGNTATIVNQDGNQNYIVLVRNNQSGCENTLIQTIADNSEVPVLTLTTTDNSICDPALTYNGTVSRNTITDTHANGTDTYSFVWSTGNDMSSPIAVADDAVPTLGGRNGGFYTVTVTNDRLNCTSNPVTAQVINNQILPAISAVPLPSTNCAPGTPNGEIAASVTNIVGAETYSYQWYSGNSVTAGNEIANLPNQGNTSTVIQLQGGLNYTVNVRNQLTGCTNFFTQALADISELPTFSLAVVNNQNCVAPFNGSLTVTGLNDNNSSATDTYNVTWYDANVAGGPVSQSNLNVPQATIGAGSVRAARDNGFYTVQITNNRLGCTSSPVTSEVLDNLEIPVISTAVTASTNCVGGTPNGEAKVTGILPADTYEHRWYAGNMVGGAVINGGINDVDIDGIQGGAGANYTVEVLRTTTGCTGTATVTILDNSQVPVVAALDHTDNLNCTLPFNGTATVPAGAVTYHGTVINNPYAGFELNFDGENADNITARGANTYSFTIRHISDNCTSNPVTVTILDNLVYPVIDVAVVDQTSCDLGTPNGSLTATVAGGTAGYGFQWFQGIGTVAPATEITDAVTPNVIADLASDDYTAFVTNSTTRCASTVTVFLPDNIVNPSIAFQAVTNVTSCAAPNGEATPIVTNVSGVPNTDFSIYYVETFTGNAFPTDPAIIKASPDVYSSTLAVVDGSNPPVVTGLAPGYLTAVVVDNFTSCESTPVTVQIDDATIENVITLDLASAAGFCGGVGGGIEVSVAGGIGPHTFEWHKGTPTNSNINFYNNPPVFATPIIANTQDLGMPGTAPGVDAGSYTVVVRDAVGCGAYFVDNVPFAGVPVVNIAKTDVSKCDPGPYDGAIDVTVTGTPAVTYDIILFQGNSPVTSLNSAAGVQNVVLNTPGLEDGQYLIRVIDNTPANVDCPLDFQRTLIQNAYKPIVTIDDVIENTACDDTNFADGQISLTARKDILDTTVPNYSITAINPAPIGYVAPTPLVEGVNSGLISGFAPTTYTITVTDAISGCVTDTDITIPDQPVVPQLLNVAVTPETYCAPFSNGQAQITSVSPVGVNDYSYSWYSDAGLTSLEYQANGGAGGEIFDDSKAGYAAGVAGQGYGNQTIYVRGERLPGTGPGVGCPTPAVTVVIPDEHATPVSVLTLMPNTSCDPLVGEGSISITSQTVSPDVAVQNGLYTYTINPDPNAIGADAGNAGAVPFIFDRLLDAAYAVTTMNDLSGCIVQNNVTILPNKFQISITDHLFAHQLICNPDGDIDVTEIVIDRSLTGQANLTFPTDAAINDNFDFEWFRAPVASPGTFDPSAPLTDPVANGGDVIATKLLTGNLIPANGEYENMGGGTYYVIATRKGGAGALTPVVGLGCETVPLRVDIQDNHVNPVVRLSPFSDTSCTGPGEGSIEVDVTDASVIAGPFTYSYAWTTTGLTLPVTANPYNGTNNLFSPLDEGDYTNTVTNNETGCTATATTTIFKNVTPIFVTDIKIVPQLYCDPSGRLEVTGIEFEDRNGNTIVPPIADFEFDWTRATVGSVGTTSASLDSVTYAGIGFGQYSVFATRTAGAPGLGCESAPINLTIEDKRIFPEITLTPFSNTSCAISFEGAIEVDISDGSAPKVPPVAATYDYTWTAVNPLVLALPPDDNDQTGVNNLYQNLQDGTYRLDVVSDVTGCTAQATTTIIKNQTPVFLTVVNATPQFYCDPSGKLEITGVTYNDRDGVTQNGLLTEFTYTWARDVVGNTVATTMGSNPRGTYLDSLVYAGIGFDPDYYVVATRTTGSPGAGCSSAPVKVEIQDAREYPNIVLTPFSNTSCTVAFEGQIEVDITDASAAKVAPSADAGQPILYDYTWADVNTAGLALPPNQAGQTGLSNLYQNLEDGTYRLTAVNTVTGCSSQTTTTIIKNQTPVFLTVVNPTPQFYCDPSGRLEVTNVNYNDRDGNTINGAISDFTFTWARGVTTNTVATTIGSAPRGAFLDSLVYAGIGYDPNYYVVATRTNGTPGAGCSSAPIKVEVTDMREYPVIALTPFSNTSCTAAFEGEIEVDITDSSAPKVAPSPEAGQPILYDYTWADVNTPGLGLPPNQAGQTGVNNVYQDLEDGTYRLTAVNTITGCSSTATTTIIKNQTPVFLTVVNPTPQFYCDPSGRLEVTEVNYNDRDGNNVNGLLSDFSFTWARGVTTNTVATTLGSAPRGAFLDSLVYPTIGYDPNYYVVATRVNGSPGAGCASAPIKVEVTDMREYPSIVLTPFSNTSCTAAFEGEIEIDITDSSAPKVAPSPDAGQPVLYDYTWADVNAAGLALPAPQANQTGINNLYQTLEDGTYRLTAVNTITGCSSQSTTTIIRNQTPIFVQDVDMIPQLYCSPSGHLEVRSITYNDRDGVSQVGPLADFTFAWTRNDLVTAAGTTDGSLARGTFLDSLSYAGPGAIGFGTYYVVATRNNGTPGAGCQSAPFRMDITDKRENPVVGFTTVANTACDNNFDGQITVLSNTTNLPGAGSNYSIDWITVPAGSTVAFANNVGASYTTLPTDVIGTGSFTVRVTNLTTGCATDAVVDMISNPQPVEILTVDKLDQMICLPDGSITVTAVEPALVTDYSFNWFRNDAASPALEDGASTVITSSTLNNVNYPSIGSDTYFVVGQKASAGGSGCLTPPFRVELEDLHVDPTLAFTFTPNSSCNPTDPNGQLLATAQERDGSTDVYTFAWTLNAAALPAVTTQLDASPTSELGNAFEGNYALVVTNSTTGCSFTSGVTVNLDHNVSLPNIIQVDPIHPTTCVGDGSAEVTAISIGGGPAITGAVLATDFQYEWYEDDFVPANQLATTTPLLAPLAHGKYYVRVQDLTTDCKSAPTEVVINDRNIIYPVVTIDQTALQISCVTTSGTAALLAQGDGFTDANADYNFQWFNNVEATGAPFATTSAISDLLDGEYSVTVENVVSGCSASRLYVIRDDSDRYMPILSLTSQGRIDCLNPDGILQAREVGREGSDYPLPVNFSAHLYPGENADVSQVGQAMTLFNGNLDNWLESNMDAGFYTVKLTDNNTGCFVTGVEQVLDERVNPVVDIIEDNPLINCDPARPNGQLSATADGGLVGGYQFDWYGGNAASGAVIGTNNKLLRLAMGDYTVRVTNNMTHCFADATRSISDGRLFPPAPTAVVMFDRTRCDYPDGWVSANVNGVTFNFTFDWYDGNAVKSSPDFVGINYQNRDIGFYSVTAMDQTTGCVSLPTSVEVKDLRVIPEVIITTTPSYCEELPGQVGGTGTAQIQLNPADVVSDEVVWSLADDGTTLGIGSYLTNILPGFYQASVVTSQGCPAVGVGEVKTEVFSYNLVSTNGDQKNDNFRIDCITQFPNNNVKIFNRAGVLVYEANGYDNNDVVFKGLGEKGVYTIGNELPVGTYFYIIDKRDGSKPKTGYLELVR